MTDKNFNEHYHAFKWAVSQKWKNKNKLYESIQGKIKILNTQYGLSMQDVTDDLFSNYWVKGHYNKYNENKGSLNNWIAHYVNLYLNHTLRKHAVRAKDIINQRIDPLDPRNQANLVYLDKDNKREDDDYQPDINIDPTNPEDILIGKELMQFAYNHFNKTEVEYLMGELDIGEAASISGISDDSFRKRVDRKKTDFLEAVKIIDKN